VSQEQYDINLDSPSLQASRELREWIKRRLIVERGGRIFATDALEGAITFVESLDNTKLRAERLLPPGNWPLCLPIGKPSAKIFPEQAQRVLQHVQLWRQVIVGRVEWEEVSYRASDGPISMPLRWLLDSPSDWINAAADATVSREFRLRERIIEQVDPIIHALLVNHPSLWRHKDPQDIISAARLACRLEPGCAKGLPLRLLSGQGVDTKFTRIIFLFLTRLLDVRFSGEASEQGLTHLS